MLFIRGIITYAIIREECSKRVKKKTVALCCNRMSHCVWTRIKLKRHANNIYELDERVTWIFVSVHEASIIYDNKKINQVDDDNLLVPSFDTCCARARASSVL